MRWTFIILFSCTIAMGQQEDQSKRRGEYIMANTLKVLSKAKDTTYADHWNLAMAYCLLKRDKDSVVINLIKSRDKNKANFFSITSDLAEYYGGIRNTVFYKMLGDEYLEIIAGFQTFNDNKKIINDPQFKSKDLRLLPKSSKDTSSLDYSLISKLIQMSRRDQLYRSDFSYLKDDEIRQKQDKLDIENSKDLERIFTKYGYPGKSLVGSRYCNHASIILEHSFNIEFLKKWFPFVSEAYNKGELSENAFKLLIDRYHWRITGKQIFGTQLGIPLDKEEVIKTYIAQYNF